MESSIFGFIWKYSKRQQLVILALSIVLLPLNYYSYDIPKQIVNQALGSNDSPVFFGYTLDRIDLLMLLCGLFLAVVLVSGGVGLTPLLSMAMTSVRCASLLVKSSTAMNMMPPLPPSLMMVVRSSAIYASCLGDDGK